MALPGESSDNYRGNASIRGATNHDLQQEWEQLQRQNRVDKQQQCFEKMPAIKQKSASWVMYEAWQHHITYICVTVFDEAEGIAWEK